MLRALCALCLLAAPAALAAPTWEGPLPADRGRDLSRGEEPAGMRFGVSASAGVFDRDPVVGAAASVALDHRYVRAQMSLPVMFRVYDLPPRGPTGNAAVCQVLSCAALVNPRTGELDVLRGLGVVDRFEVRAPYDIAALEAGPLVLAHETRTLVDDMATRRAHTDREMALRLSLQWPDERVRFRAQMGDVARPLSFMSATASVAPGAFFFGAGSAWWQRLLARGRVGVEAAADVGAERTPRDQTFALPPDARGLYALAAFAKWPLLDRGRFTFTPGAAASLTHGVEGAATWALGVGAGVRAGAEAVLNLPFVALRVDARGALSTAGHRHALFGPFYTLERARALASGAAPKGTASTSAAPSGWGADLRFEAQAWRWARSGMSLHIDNAAAYSRAGAFFEVSAAGARAMGAVWRRGFSLPSAAGVSASEWPGPPGAYLATFAADAAVWGPFSVYARAVYAPREHAHGFRHDIDVYVGVSAQLALRSTLDILR